MRIRFTILVFLGSCFLDLSNAHTRESDSVLMIAGQSREEFTNYLTDVCQNETECQRPGGAAFYTSLELNGIYRPHANIPGDNHQDLWFLSKVYEPLAIQVGLWLGSNQLADINKGTFDRNIDALTSQLSALNRPVFVRIGYEFDGPHNAYNPPAFILAYQRIAKTMRRDPKLRLVWHSFALQPTHLGHDVMQWYPGDNYVDWIGISFFQVDSQGYFDKPNRARLVELAREKHKPIMIAEASAIRYTEIQKRAKGQDYWDYWYKPLFQFIESTPEVRALSIINVDWNTQKQHRELSWGDARLNADHIVLSNWRSKMNQEYWLFSGPDLYEKIKRLENVNQ